MRHTKANINLTNMMKLIMQTPDLHQLTQITLLLRVDLLFQWIYIILCCRIGTIIYLLVLLYHFLGLFIYEFNKKIKWNEFILLCGYYEPVEYCPTLNLFRRLSANKANSK